MRERERERQRDKKTVKRDVCALSVASSRSTFRSSLSSPPRDDDDLNFPANKHGGFGRGGKSSSPSSVVESVAPLERRRSTEREKRERGKER